MIKKRFGITRQVFLIGKWAFKIPQTKYGFRYFCRGILANYSEQEFGGWNNGYYVPEPPALRPNPVIKAFPFGLCNVYLRATPFLGSDEEMKDEWFGFFGDPKPDNIGYIDDELVVLDFDCYPRCPECVKQ